MIPALALFAEVEINSGVARGGGGQVGARALGRRPWGRHSTLFAVF